MSRERYDTTLTCPECGHSGTARVSENDYPFMRSLDRTILNFPAGMSEAKPSRKENITHVLCKCGAEFDA